MKAEVLEWFVSSRKQSRPSEDVVVTEGNHLAVIDGAGLPTSVMIDGQSAGLFVANNLAKAICLLPPDIIVTHAVRVLTAHLKDELDAHLSSYSSLDPPPAASLVVLSTATRRVWRVGTGTARFGGTSYGRTQPLEELRSTYRSAYLTGLRLLGELSTSQLPANADVPDPLLAVQHAFQNSEHPQWGFGVLDGRAVPNRYIDELPIPKGVDEIILATDGYPEVADTLAATERLLTDSLQADPLRIGERPEVKGLELGALSFDDRAYLRVRLYPTS